MFSVGLLLCRGRGATASSADWFRLWVLDDIMARNMDCLVGDRFASSKIWGPEVLAAIAILFDQQEICGNKRRIKQQRGHKKRKGDSEVYPLNFNKEQKGGEADRPGGRKRKDQTMGKLGNLKN